MSCNRPEYKYVADYGKDVVIQPQNVRMYHLVAMNNSGSSFWLQLFDSVNNTPSGVPDFEVEIPSAGFVAFPFHKEGWQFGKGLYARPVTASQGSTVISAANCKITAQYDIYPIN